MKSGPENLARTVIYDPVTQNLRATRYGLYETGFRDIEGFNDLADLRTRLAERPMDLLIAESGGGSGEIYDLVRGLRKGEVGQNPFAVVFLTSWRADADAISTALRSGADDIIMRPFSTNFMENRIRTAIDHRKQFVVTSDYLGPDRRRNGTPARDEPPLKMFTPPNTLKSAVTGDRAALDAVGQQVEAFKNVVRRERAVRLAVRIGVEIQLAAEGKRPASVVYGLARELYVAVDPVDAEAAKLAAAMVRSLSAGDDVQKSFKLARELALGICVLCGEKDESGDAPYVEEIETLIARIRDRDIRAA